MSAKSWMVCILTYCIGELPATFALFTVSLRNCYAQALNIAFNLALAFFNAYAGGNKDFRKLSFNTLQEVIKLTVCIKRNLSLKWLADNLFVSCKFKRLLNVKSYCMNSVPLSNEITVCLYKIRLRNFIKERRFTVSALIMRH